MSYGHPVEVSAPPGYDNQTFTNDRNQYPPIPAYPPLPAYPPQYAPTYQPHPQQQQQQQVTIRAVPITDTKSVYCGAVLGGCSVISLVMFLVFLIRYPVSPVYLSLPIQVLLSAITGGLLVSAGRRTDPACMYATSILFGVGNIIISLFHVVYVGNIFSRKDYIDSDGNAVLASVLVISIIDMISTLVALVLSCYRGCCVTRQSTVMVTSGNEVMVGYVHQGSVVVTPRC